MLILGENEAFIPQLFGGIIPKTWYNWVYASSSGSWNSKTSGVGSDLMAITYGNGKYIAVGNSGKILVSTDKETWTPKTSGSSSSIDGIAYNPDDDVFIAVDAYGTSYISTDDGDTWTKKACHSDGLYAIAYGNGKWIAVGQEGEVVVSTDNGANWTRYNERIYNHIYGITYNPNNQTFYCVTNKGIHSTTNGSSWTQELSPNSTYFYGITFGNNKLIAVGNKIYSSSGDGTWTEETLSQSKIFRSIAYGNGKFTAVGYSGTIMSSSGDGTWVEESSGISSILYGVTYGSDWVAVGANGVILSYGNSLPLSCYTEDQNPTTSSTVYSAPNTASALTITSVGTGTITLSDTNTYNYNPSGNIITY